MPAIDSPLCYTLSRVRIASTVALLLCGGVRPRADANGESAHARVDLLRWTAARGAPQLEALLHYFSAIWPRNADATALQHLHDEQVQVQRVRLADGEAVRSRFATSEAVLARVELLRDAALDEADGDVLVDFAHDLLGGGVFAGVRAQEELLMSAWPELLFAAVCCARLEDDETVVVRNAVQFARFSGYGKSLACAGAIAPLVRGKTIVAMDATNVNHNKRKQFLADTLHRDLLKCFVAFDAARGDAETAIVATGAWGSGAFANSISIKLCQQVLSASLTGCTLRYCAFADKKIADEATATLGKLQKFRTVSALFAAMDCASKEASETGVFVL